MIFSLRYFLNSVKLLTPGIGDIPEQILNTGKEDVLVAVSFKRYSREAVHITEKMRNKGVFIIAITDSELSPITRLADMKLIVRTEIATYIDSITAAMSLINALIISIAIRKKNSALSELKKLEDEFVESRTYME